VRENMRPIYDSDVDAPEAAGLSAAEQLLSRLQRKPGAIAKLRLRPKDATSHSFLACRSPVCAAGYAK